MKYVSNNLDRSLAHSVLFTSTTKAPPCIYPAFTTLKYQLSSSLLFRMEPERNRGRMWESEEFTPPSCSSLSSHCSSRGLYVALSAGCYNIWTGVEQEWVSITRGVFGQQISGTTQCGFGLSAAAHSSGHAIPFNMPTARNGTKRM